MTVASPESVELEEQRAELNAVLESKEFTRAPALAHLLSYLCKKLFAGEAGQIKEYSVGVEVFRRGASFDQDSDSIVRVEANRLRKRLAEFYAGEGNCHRLQITIPVGQYVPRFERAFARNALTQSFAAESRAGQTQAIGTPLQSPIGWISAEARRLRWIGVFLLFMLLGALAVLFIARHDQKSVPAVSSNQPATPEPEPQIGLPAGEEVRILAGEGRSYVDHAGKLWGADNWFTGGSPVKSSVQHIWRTQDPSFYRNSRQGQFHYDIPLKKGLYELRLHFAETVFGPESTGTGGEGDRIMTVRANGKTLLTNFDVVADAGASRTADVKVFPEISPDRDGMLHLEFAGEDGKQAALSAIEILPGAGSRIRPVRILARQTPYYSNDSHWWSPDNYFEGGELATYTTLVTGTDDPELDETERWGNFSYAIPVAPGKYAVTLHFAIRHGEWDGPVTSPNDHAIAHVFNVFCNGTALLRNFNLLKEARQGDVVIRRFSSLRPNAQGKLLLSFVPVEGYATVTGIEVVPQ
jgi:hypothetical protein